MMPERVDAVADVQHSGAGKQRSGAEQRPAHDGCHRHRRRHRQIAARAPFEQQQLHREQHRRERGVEGCRHAGRGAGHQQGLALVGGQPEELCEQRANRATGHDDRPLGAERAAGADRDRRRDRLERSHPGLHLAPAQQDRLDRLRHAVAADLLRAEPGQQADQQAAADRSQQHQQRVVPAEAGRDQPGAVSGVEHRVGDQRDQPQQHPGQAGADRPDRQRQGDDGQHLAVGGEVGEVTDVAAGHRLGCGLPVRHRAFVS